MPITLKQLRSASFREVYRYGDASSPASFVIFSSDIYRLTITHDFRRGKPPKISYMARGRYTDSPSQAVRYWNQEEIREKSENAARHIA